MLASRSIWAPATEAAPRESSSTTSGTSHALPVLDIPAMDLRMLQTEVRTSQPQGQKRLQADTIVELASPTTDTSQLQVDIY